MSYVKEEKRFLQKSEWLISVKRIPKIISMPSGVLILNIEGCHCKQGSRIKDLDIMKEKLICRHKECVQMLLYVL
jgi:hypothetical protein